MSLKFEILRNVKSESANFILKDFMPIPKNAVTLLSSKGGIGKTRCSLIMADRFIKETENNVALWLTEDYKGQVRYTFDEMVKAGLVSEHSLDNMILILEEPPQLAKRENGVFKANYEEINKIGEVLIKNDVHFAVFDPLLAFYGGNENDNSEARVFIQSFAEWAKKAQITTLIIHHANKDGNSRGATAFHDGVRARYELDFIKDDNDEVDMEKMQKGLRMVKLKKDNWGIRQHLWKLSDGEDEVVHKLMPEMRNESKYSSEPTITEYTPNNDNDFLGGLLNE